MNRERKKWVEVLDRLHLTKPDETPVLNEYRPSDSIKMMAVFGFIPLFCISMIHGFWSASKGRHPLGVLIFSLVVITLLILYLALANYKTKKLGLPPLTKRQILVWMGIWVLVYAASVVLATWRLGVHRQIWRDFVGIDIFLWLSSLPWSGWLLRKR